MINYISHKKSKQLVNGLPKLPTSDQLKEGEIAINYANGYETLSIKNSENEIITFSSTEQFEKYVDTTIGNKLGSGFTGGNSANTVTSVVESNEKITSSALNDLNERKLDATAYTPTDLSDYYKKEETSGKTELNSALGLKANTSDLTAHTGNTTVHITSGERTKWNNATSILASHSGNTTVHITSDERSKWNGKISNVQYNKTDKKIYFYSGATTETPISNIDATDFIKDGMVSNVEIKDVANSGSCLVITFNADAGKQDITIPVTKIFNPANYYLKSETSGKTEISTALNLKANTSDLAEYYKKTETSGSTQLTTALNSKANATDLTAHTGNSTIHITSDERTKWNNASTNSHTHTNKAVLDSITAIDTELSETSNNLVVNSAITTVILANERIASSSLNDLNERKLDASAYTPTDLSDYYKKEETSGKTELDTAFGLKANTSDLTTHTGNNTVHIASAERTKWNGKISSVQYNKTDRKINFYSGATTETPVSSIDATDFIKDGMVSNVEIKDVASSGSCLVITFNADAGKQNITIPISKIFNSANYYLKSETSGKTEIATALSSKANTTDLTAHTGNSTIHITTDERTKWNNAVASSHTHANKAVLDSIAAIDTELSETSNNLVVNSAITKVIVANEKIASSSLNELNEKKLDASAYTPTDLSDYYKKEETSGKTELENALKLKANASDLSGYYKKTETSGKTELDTALGLKANTSDLTAHTSDSTIHITSDERTKWNNASASSHTHANKAVLDTITAIDTELSETSNNLVVNSAITKVIEDNEKIASASLNDLNERKLDASAYTPTDLSDYYKKEETSGKTELDDALKLKANSTDLVTKANTSDLIAHTGNSTIHITSNERNTWNGKISNVQYNKTDKKIYFYSGATTETPISNIDATDFIKDGMVSNVEIKDVASSGSCLVITFNADAGKQDITIPVTKIFNPKNYYLKTETSGKTELDTAFNSKANASDLTAHTEDSTVHITSAERTKWNDAATSSHTHANKAVLDTITAIDKELSETSNNLVVNSAITTVILANEKITSSSLNDLNDRKLDASAYTPTDLSDYYKKEETSSKTELTTALGLKANSADLTAHTGNATVHITSEERTKWNGAATTLASHSGDTIVHITSDERTKWNNASASSHTHANKAVLDTITAIDTELSETSNNLVVNSAITKVIEDNERITSASLNDLNERKLDASAYTPTDLSDYYKKEETSGNTELNTALDLKANSSDLTAHTGNSTIHITAAERTKWNNAATSSHTHANKAVLDKITAIDAELSETSNNLVVNSAITKVILDDEKTVSAALNELNDRKLDASAYTPTDLSDYYKKEETSGKSEIATALSSKANASTLSNYYKKTETSGSTQLTTAFNSKANTSHKHLSKDITDKVTAITESNSGSTSVPTVSAVMQVFKDNEEVISSALNDLNKRINQLNALIKNYEARIKALESK